MKKKSRVEFSPRVVAFVCKWCSGSDGNSEGGSAKKSPFKGSQVSSVSVMCSGRVQPGFVLSAFELGADGVIICGCERGSCHYSTGNEQQLEMFETSKNLIKILGLEPERLKLELLPPQDTGALNRVTEEFLSQVRKAGPSPLRRQGGNG
ncbi:MAG: hydrogenase iron-sulfur subunit [Candidatus Eiseniibacteriota bacterium]|nr:MAG: hydrogenase iron-sulfur subunit [Candidatus Eisenbacteria bacterium]